MPDTKFTWPGLLDHIRRYLWIYLAGIAACLILTGLLWTTTQPRIPEDRSVIVYLLGDTGPVEPLDDVARDMLERGQAVDGTLQQVEFQALHYLEDDMTSTMVLMTRLSVPEGDAWIASQAGLDALVNAQALMPLDGIVADGWMSRFGLEPCYVTYVDPEGEEESQTYLAGLRLDPVDALLQRKSFNNEGAVLCVSAASTNPETTLRTLEFMIEDLMEGNGHAATEDTEPAA